MVLTRGSMWPDEWKRLAEGFTAILMRDPGEALCAGKVDAVIRVKAEYRWKRQPILAGASTLVHRAIIPASKLLSLGSRGEESDGAASSSGLRLIDED
jgi:hypothetical protein